MKNWNKTERICENRAQRGKRGKKTGAPPLIAPCSRLGALSCSNSVWKALKTPLHSRAAFPARPGLRALTVGSHERQTAISILLRGARFRSAAPAARGGPQQVRRDGPAGRRRQQAAAPAAAACKRLYCHASQHDRHQNGLMPLAYSGRRMRPSFGRHGSRRVWTTMTPSRWVRPASVGSRSKRGSKHKAFCTHTSAVHLKYRWHVGLQVEAVAGPLTVPLNHSCP